MRTYAAVMPVGRASIRGLVRSEWMKLRTVRSTMWTLGLLSVGTLLFVRRDA